MTNVGALVIVAVYLVGMLLVGFVVGKLKIKDSEDYMVAGRRMGIFMVAFSLSANNIGGGSTTGLAQKAFEDWGMSAIWYVLAASIAMIPLAYFAPRIRKTMAVTIPEVIERRFGKGSATFSAVLNILALFCLTTILFLATWMEQKLGRHVIVILSKVTGLILAAMASQMVFTGIRTFLVP